MKLLGDVDFAAPSSEVISREIGSKQAELSAKDGPHTECSSLFNETTLMSINNKASQINLLHSKASFYLLAVRLAKLQNCAYMFLVQKPWVRFNKVYGISVSG